MFACSNLQGHLKGNHYWHAREKRQLAEPLQGDISERASVATQHRQQAHRLSHDDDGCTVDTVGGGRP
jgi:hypothetical protein